jgi:predicted membrane-bound spermidine synthase
MLHHVFGSTSVATSTVTSVFMAGLGLGAWLFGKYADRIKHPLMTYAVAEFGVAICGLLIPFLVAPDGFLASVNAWMRASFGTGSTTFAIVRFFAVAPLLFVPTTLMGSTLPLLAKHFMQERQRASAASSRVGILYALNTFGAVAGTFVCGFILMPRLGLAFTNYTAIAMNLVLALTIFGFRKTLLRGVWTPGEPLGIFPSKAPAADHVEPALDDTSVEAEEENVVFVPPLARKLALIAFGASGAVALANEVVWTRALANVIGSSNYSFTIILMTFLTGITVGSAYLSSVLKSARQSLVAVGVVSVLLTFLANAPNAVVGRSSLADYLVGVGVGTALIGVVGLIAFLRMRATGPFQSTSDKELAGIGLAFLAVPMGTALIYVITAKAYVERITRDSQRVLEGPGVPELLPRIVLAVVVSISLYLAISIALRRSHVVLLAILQFFIGWATFINYVVADDVPLAFGSLVANLQNGDGAALATRIGTVQFFMFVTAALCTLPATLGMGAMFPLTMRIWSSGSSSIARDVGVVYPANTIGSIVGAWLPGFLLMPWIGMERTLHLGIALNLLLALLMVVGSASDEHPPEGSRFIPLPKAQVGLVYGLACIIPLLGAVGYLMTAKPDSALRWDLSRMTLGVFRVSHVRDMLDPSDWGSPDLVYYRDGLSTTVSVERWGSHLALKNNGKVDASNGDDMPTQIMVAGYPLLMHPNGPTDLDVAVVGFGSGVSVGASLQFPVRSVKVIELERAIPEAARFFADVNHLNYSLDHFPFIEMPRLEIIDDDGRNYLASTANRFDLIMSEPSNPWITGVSDLFTSDHFRIAKKSLKPKGIYCQWVQLYEMSPENIKSIFRTFAEQFRYVIVFAADDFSSDTVMLGSDEPLALDLARMDRAFGLPGVREELLRAKIESPHDILSRVLLASRDEVLAYSHIEEHREGGVWIQRPESHNNGPCDPAYCRRRPAPLNTDDNAHIEFAAPRDLIGYARYEGYLMTVYSPDWPYGRLDGVVEGAGTGAVAARNYAELAFSLMEAGRRLDAATFIERSKDAGESPETFLAEGVRAFLLSDDREPRVQLSPPVPGPELDARTAERLTEGFDRARAAIDQRLWDDALAAFEQIPAPLRSNSGPSMRFLEGYLRYKVATNGAARFEPVVSALSELVRTAPQYVEANPEVFYFLAKAHDKESEFRAATQAMRGFVTRIFEREAQAAIARQAAEAALNAAAPASPDSAPTTPPAPVASPPASR